MNDTEEQDVSAMSADEAAGYWDARLRASDCGEQDRAAHRAWREADPENARAFETLQTLIGDLPSIANRPEIQSMRAAALDRSDQSSDFTERRRTWLPIGGAIAASLALAVMASLFFFRPSDAPTSIASAPAPSFVTEVGELSTVPLDDGSAVVLNTSSRIDVRYADEERAVVLVEGEAHFDVAPNSERPFVVYAGDFRVVAVGTAFDVRLDDGEVKVTVTEGRVAVERVGVEGYGGAELVAGQQLAVGRSGQAQRSRADLASATSWRERRATFDDVPLALAAREMNRYSRIQLVVDDPQLASTRISGMFRTGEQDSFVEALERYFGVSARRISATEIKLEPAPAS